MARACLRTVATPYFPGWPDTIQLNYGNPDLQEAMIGELLRFARQCDGLRCDMAVLILPEVAANFSDHQSQARLRLPFATPDDEIHCFKDLLDDTIYERKGSELTTDGLYLDLPAWSVHIFSVSVWR